jgi:putative transposase
MAPLRGWLPRGDRPVGKVPWGHWNATTFIAALPLDRINAPWLLDGPINSESFRVYVERELVPTFKPFDIVIADKLGSHKNKAAR